MAAYIRLSQWVGRKDLTDLWGAELSPQATEKLIKQLKQRCQCNGTIVPGGAPDGGDLIQLQGDRRKDVRAVLADTPWHFVVYEAPLALGT